MEDDEIVVTDAVRQAVNREDCKLAGHNFEIVMVMASNDPVAVVCHRCGETWNIPARERP